MGVNLSQKTRHRRRKPDDPVNGLPEPKVRPIILTVDDERKDLELAERELRKRYEAATELVEGDFSEVAPSPWP